MLKANLIIFLVGISPVLEASAAFCTKREQNDEVIRICCPGYVGDGWKCTPSCGQGCINGVCVKPMFCVCNEGFTKNNGPRSPCEPTTAIVNDTQPVSCQVRCSNGTCVNGLCTCAEGWLLQQHEGHDICVPQCNGGCVNGYCSSTNTCVCHEGFEPQTLNQFECIRRSCSSAHWPQLAQIIRILASLLLISCYYAYWRNINAHPQHPSKSDLKSTMNEK